MTTEHSPLPWSTHGLSETQWVMDADEQIVAICENFEGNAAHIVRCVNSHADLVKALEVIYQLACSTDGGPLINQARREMIQDRARAALAKAKP